MAHFGCNARSSQTRRPQNVHHADVAHKYRNILIHVVLSTQERGNLIPTNLLPRLAKYFAGIGRNYGLPVLAAGGTANHVHLLSALPSDITTAKAARYSKPIARTGLVSMESPLHCR